MVPVCELELVGDPRQETSQAIEGVGHGLHVVGSCSALVARLGLHHVQHEGSTRTRERYERDHCKRAHPRLMNFKSYTPKRKKGNWQKIFCAYRDEKSERKDRSQAEQHQICNDGCTRIRKTKQVTSHLKTEKWAKTTVSVGGGDIKEAMQRPITNN